MVGKAALFLVMGFSVIFMIFGHDFNSASNQAIDNYTEYYTESVAHGLAESGANLAANAIFLDNTWMSGYSNLSDDDGEINVSIIDINPGEYIREIVSTGTFEGKTDTVEVIISPNRFSGFAYYSQVEGNIWWTGKDTVFGPFHTQDNMQVAGHPVFGYIKYPTTCGGKLIYQYSKQADYPNFFGSFHDSSPLTLPDSGLQPLRNAAADGGFMIPQDSTSSTTYTQKWVRGTYTWVNGRYQYVPGHYESIPSTTTSLDTVYLDFLKDSIQVKMGYDKQPATYKTSKIAPNGVIYAQGMDVRLQGTVEGNYSVVSDGDVYLDNDIVYNTNPLTHPNSTDLLGILAEKNVIITENAANDNNINIDAAIYCQEDGFGAQNYKTRPVSGNINLLGGITQNIRGAVGTFTTNKSGEQIIDSGFNKIYHYDVRLSHMFPPYFPVCGGFKILSWKD